MTSFLRNIFGVSPELIRCYLTGYFLCLLIRRPQPGKLADIPVKDLVPCPYLRSV